MKNSVFAAVVLAAAFGAVPAMAQTTSAGGTPPSGSQAAPGTATINPSNAPPSQRNPLLADNGDVQIGKLIGTDVYSKEDKQLGSVNEVLAGQNGQLQAVISTNNKKVLVPWNKLQFGNAKLNSHNKVLMPDETQAQLNKMPAFKAQKSGND